MRTTTNCQHNASILLLLSRIAMDIVAYWPPIPKANSIHTESNPIRLRYASETHAECLNTGWCSSWNSCTRYLPIHGLTIPRTGPPRLTSTYLVGDRSKVGSWLNDTRMGGDGWRTRRPQPEQASREGEPLLQMLLRQDMSEVRARRKHISHGNNGLYSNPIHNDSWRQLCSSIALAPKRLAQGFY